MTFFNEMNIISSVYILIQMNESVNNQDSSETSNSINTPPSTSDESLELVEVSNDPHNVTSSRSVPKSTPPVLVQSDTSKNSNYAELMFPDNRPIVPPPSDTNVTYSQAPLHLQVLLLLKFLH